MNKRKQTKHFLKAKEIEINNEIKQLRWRNTSSLQTNTVMPFDYDRGKFGRSFKRPKTGRKRNVSQTKHFATEKQKSKD